MSGQPQFGLFEIAPVGLSIMVAGALYLLAASGRLAKKHPEGRPQPVGVQAAFHDETLEAGGQLGASEVFAERHRLDPLRALAAVGIFVGVVLIAAIGLARLPQRPLRARYCSSSCALSVLILLRDCRNSRGLASVGHSTHQKRRDLCDLSLAFPDLHHMQVSER